MFESLTEYQSSPKNTPGVNLKCDTCGNIFARDRRSIRRDVPPEKQTHFCSKDCVSKSRHRFKMLPCRVCSKQVRRVLSSIHSNGNIFCGSSCAATYLGSAFPKKKKKPIICVKCGEESFGRSRLYCKEHSFPHLLNWSKLTYGQVQLTGSKKNQKVREHAKYICLDKECQNCSYSKYVEVCHVKPISSFPADALVIIINHPSNLVALCPNCHKELDRKLLRAEDITGWASRQGLMLANLGVPIGTRTPVTP